MQTGRNDPCPCGSGKKYKKCHADEDAKARSAELAAQAAERAAAAAEAADDEEEGEEAQDPTQPKKPARPAKTGGTPPRKGPQPKNPTTLRRRGVA